MPSKWSECESCGWRAAYGERICKACAAAALEVVIEEGRKLREKTERNGDER